LKKALNDLLGDVGGQGINLLDEKSRWNWGGEGLSRLIRKLDSVTTSRGNSEIEESGERRRRLGAVWGLLTKWGVVGLRRIRELRRKGVFRPARFLTRRVGRKKRNRKEDYRGIGSGSRRVWNRSRTAKRAEKKNGD